jgi:hypothetical protein
MYRQHFSFPPQFIILFEVTHPLMCGQIKVSVFLGFLICFPHICKFKINQDNIHDFENKFLFSLSSTRNPYLHLSNININALFVGNSSKHKQSFVTSSTNTAKRTFSLMLTHPRQKHLKSPHPPPPHLPLPTPRKN